MLGPVILASLGFGVIYLLSGVNLSKKITVSFNLSSAAEPITITVISPTVVALGDTITICGKNLDQTIQAFDPSGGRHTTKTGNLINDNKTQVSYVVSDELVLGMNQLRSGPNLRDFSNLVTFEVRNASQVPPAPAFSCPTVSPSNTPSSSTTPSPSSSNGHYKINGSICYWDSNDEGPDQCVPTNTPTTSYSFYIYNLTDPARNPAFLVGDGIRFAANGPANQTLKSCATQNGVTGCDSGNYAFNSSGTWNLDSQVLGISIGNWTRWVEVNGVKSNIVSFTVSSSPVTPTPSPSNTPTTSPTPTPGSTTRPTSTPDKAIPRATITKILRPGMRNNQVMTLQEFLVSRGYMSGNTTVYYGQLTTTAVRKYQCDKKIFECDSAYRMKHRVTWRTDQNFPLTYPWIISPYGWGQVGPLTIVYINGEILEGGQ